jgi:hypothetical protein
MDFNKYFQQYEDYFWKCNFYYDEDNNFRYVFESLDDTSIVYKEYITEVLELLSDDCIPPFGSLLLAIVATNPNSEASLVELHHYAKLKERTSSFPNANLYRTEAAFDFLKILASLPEVYKSGDNRILLFKIIFEKCHNRVGSETAKKLISDFKDTKSDYLEMIGSIPFNDANFIKDFRTIGLLIQKFPTKESLLKALTALPEPEKIVEALEEEVSEPLESNKKIDFVEELIQEQKTFQVGSLIQRIWSGLNIPFHHNVPSQQPIGGVSDLTNKGDFDKLLLSEFANDDMVFMSRLANNEALYIQREIPPQDNKKIRVLLLDVSLKNWGNPKIVAFATALAIAKHPKTDIECVVYAFGKQYTPVKIDTVNQVIASLQQLSGGLDGGEGLQQYFEKEYGSHKEVELFVFTQEENFESIPFTKVINEHFDKINFIITTTASGAIDTYKVKNKVRKHIKRIQLPLEELWSKKPVVQIRVIKSRNQGEVPILYPVERNYNNVFHYEGQFYLYFNTNLFAFQEEPLSKGFAKIASTIPFITGQYTLYKDKKGTSFLVNWIAEEKTLYYHDLEQKTTEAKTITINTVNTLTLFSKENNIYLSDGELFYKITDTYDCIVTDHDAVKECFKEYVLKNKEFVYNFRNDTKKYTLLKRFKEIKINNNLLIINSKQLHEATFFGGYRGYTENTIYFEERVSLLLKKHGNNKSKVVQYFLHKLNLTKTEIFEFKTEIMVIQENLTNVEAQSIKTDLENLGATCYIETTHFMSKDGSTIKSNNGILELESSNENLPTMYIPFVLDFTTALATDEVFAGNPYFLPEENDLKRIQVEQFHDNYYKPFIQHIIDYGANATTL